MPFLYKHHPPYMRVITGEPSAVDRQWLRFLSEVFQNTRIEPLQQSGMSLEVAREILGVIALDARFNSGEPNESI